MNIFFGENYQKYLILLLLKFIKNKICLIVFTEKMFKFFFEFHIFPQNYTEMPTELYIYFPPTPSRSLWRFLVHFYLIWAYPYFCKPSIPPRDTCRFHGTRENWSRVSILILKKFQGRKKKIPAPLRGPPPVAGDGEG